MVKKIKEEVEDLEGTVKDEEEEQELEQLHDFLEGGEIVEVAPGASRVLESGEVAENLEGEVGGFGVEKDEERDEGVKYEEIPNEDFDKKYEEGVTGGAIHIAPVRTINPDVQFERVREVSPAKTQRISPVVHLPETQVKEGAEDRAMKVTYTSRSDVQGREHLREDEKRKYQRPV